MSLHHNSIRKYTAALLDLFNDLDISYKDSLGADQTKNIPIKYSTREKSKLFEEQDSSQLLDGNLNVLPRSFLILNGMIKNEARTMNKNVKINTLKTATNIDYQFNSVPYNFSFDLVVQCRGMNELTQIIEQVAPIFNPTVNIDIWDGTNLNEPTRIPLTLDGINFESEEYEELSSNIFEVTFSLTLVGNLYQPIKSIARIKEFEIHLNEIQGDFYVNKDILGWDVVDGEITPKP